MSVENFRRNSILIEQGKKTNLYLFILETDKNFETELKYKNLFYLIKLDSIELNFLEIDSSTQFLDEIKSKFKFIEENQRKLRDLMNKNHYITIFRVVDIDQREDQSDPKEDLSFLDNDIGMAISPQDILQDLLNIFALYWGNYFKIASTFPISSHGFNLSNLIKNKRFEEFEGLNQNIEVFTQLREEQYYFIQKCLKMYNLSLEMANSNVSLAMSLLVSSIEVLSQKYQWADMTFENQQFGKWIMTQFEKQGNIEKDIKKELLENIGIRYMKEVYRATANFVELCIRVLKNTSFHNELTEKLFKNLYKVRSQFLHVGEQKGNSRSQIWEFNLTNNSKNDIQSFEHNEEKYARIVRIPAYNYMKGIIQKIITRFVNFLHAVRESDEDKDLYYGLVYVKNKQGILIKDENGNPILKRKIGDFKERNTVIISPRKLLKPGMGVMRNDYHREIDAIDLDKFRQMVYKIDELIEQGDLLNALEMADTQINSYLFTINYDFPRRILYQKILILLKLGNNDDALSIFTQYEIDDINEQTHSFFNLKAFIYANQKNFEKAHDIIDILLNFIENLSQPLEIFKNKLLADYTDSKGEIYQKQELYKEALDCYEKSLSYGDFPINKETKEKIDFCKKFLDESKSNQTID